MRGFLLVCGLGLPLAAAAALPIRVVNEADLAADRIAALLLEYRAWGERLYRHLHLPLPAQPVALKFTRAAGYGYYDAGWIYVPPAARAEMLETWLHELTHHATGQDSTFFFKEGVAVHTVEALFAQQRRVPQGWPNYGQPAASWARLFLDRGALAPLADWLAAPLACSLGGDGDFSLWQGYVVAGAFAGWYIESRGMDQFHRAFAARGFGDALPRLEREWLASLRRRPEPAFDPAMQLPPGPRYQAYARRLGR